MNGTMPPLKAIDAQRLDGKTADAYRKASDVIDIAHGGTGCTRVADIQNVLGIYTTAAQLGVTSNKIFDVWSQLPNPGIFIGDASGFFAVASNKLPTQYATLVLMRHHATRMAALLFESGGASAPKLVVSGRVYTIAIDQGVITGWIPLNSV